MLEKIKTIVGKLNGAGFRPSGIYLGNNEMLELSLYIGNSLELLGLPLYEVKKESHLEVTIFLDR